MRTFLLAGMFAIGCVGLSAQTTAYSHGDPTNDEQYMLEMINRARANPAAEGIRLMDTPDGAVQQAYSYWQINKTSTKAAFATYPQRPPLTFHPALIAAARAHTADMVQNNFQGHTGSDGSSLTDRYQRVSYQSQGMYGENVAAYSNSVWYGHCGLNVDWGPQNQIDLGHRKNIMNFENYNYTEIGIGITVVAGGGIPNVGPYVITQDFGLRSVRYVVGVVFEDKNKNQEYDPGEGLAGVRVQPSSGSYHAVTSSSGGYAFPYTGQSTITVTASGGGLPTSMTQSVQLTGDNVKVDFMPGGAVPGTVSLAFPANNANNLPLPANLAWRKVTGAQSYRLQVSTSQTFGNNVVVDSVVSDTTLKGVVAPCGTRTYWRVRAANENGVGPWSATWSFTPQRTTSTISAVVGPTGPAATDGDLRFTWFAGTNAPTTYELSVMKGGQRFYADTTITDTTFVVPGFTEPGVYEWRVRAKNVCGWHSWTSIASFTLSITDVIEPAAHGMHASVNPNPMDGHGDLQVSMATDDQVMLTIIDAAGRTVATQIMSLTAGEHRIALGSMLAMAADGLYTAMISSSTGRVGVRFALVR